MPPIVFRLTTVPGHLDSKFGGAGSLRDLGLQVSMFGNAIIMHERGTCLNSSATQIGEMRENFGPNSSELHVSAADRGRTVYISIHAYLCAVLFFSPALAFTIFMQEGLNVS